MGWAGKGGASIKAYVLMRFVPQRIILALFCCYPSQTEKSLSSSGYGGSFGKWHCCPWNCSKQIRLFRFND